MSWSSMHACWIVLGFAEIVYFCDSVQDVLDPSSYIEPEDAVYWPFSNNNEDAHKHMNSEQEAKLLATQNDAPRITDMSTSQFDNLIRDGQVFVVPNISSEWEMKDWDCNFFSKDKEFRTAEIQQQYSNGADPAIVPFESGWTDKDIPTGVANQEAPALAPFYWGIKDVQYEDAAFHSWKKAMLTRVQKSFKLPHFMAPGNLAFMRRTPEFWFGKPGAGAKAHMDTHVGTTMSVQLAGTKRWRLRALDARRAPYLAMIYVDGDLDSTRWEPHYNITLSKGDALFVPPGFVHETLTVGEGCASSVTFQFGNPMAVRYYRRFFPRVRRTADIHEAWPVIQGWATLGSDDVALKAGLPFTKAKSKARDIFKVVDTNKDGIASKAEVSRLLKSPDDDHSFTWHDLNEDGQVTLSEFEQGFAFWAGITHTAVAETPRKWRKYQLQDMVDFNIEDLPRELTQKMWEWAKRKEHKKSEL